MAAVVGKPFFVADFYHRICGCFFHNCFEAVFYCSNEEGWIFVSEAAAWGDISVCVYVENLAGTFAVVFAEPAAGLPGARVF